MRRKVRIRRVLLGSAIGCIVILAAVQLRYWHMAARGNRRSVIQHAERERLYAEEQARLPPSHPSPIEPANTGQYGGVRKGTWIVITLDSCGDDGEYDSQARFVAAGESGTLFEDLSPELIRRIKLPVKFDVFDKGAPVGTFTATRIHDRHRDPETWGVLWGKCELTAPHLENIRFPRGLLGVTGLELGEPPCIQPDGYPNRADRIRRLATDMDCDGKTDFIQVTMPDWDPDNPEKMTASISLIMANGTTEHIDTLSYSGMDWDVIPFAIFDLDADSFPEIFISEYSYPTSVVRIYRRGKKAWQLFFRGKAQGD